jgi:hypothetical protein
MLIPVSAAFRAYTKHTADESGCLISTYSVSTHGYAQVGWDTKLDGHGGTTAHRAAWVHVHGQIPDGVTVDHMCKNLRCVNVDHLRLLSNYENARRTSGRDWPLGQCVNGHPNAELAREPRGRLRCRVCQREQSRRYNAANPEKRREAVARSNAKRRSTEARA